MRLAAIRRSPAPGTLALAILAVLAACAWREHEPRPLQTAAALEAFGTRRLDDPDLARFARGQRAVSAPFPPAAWALDDLALAAFFFRHELEAARADVAVSRAAVASAGQRPNPVLALDQELAPGEANPWILGFTLDFTLETAGKRELRTRSAEARAAAVETQLYQRAWSVRAALRDALHEWHAATRQERLLDETRAGQVARVELQRTRLAAGDGSRFELSRVEQEAARLDHEREAAHTRAQEARAALAAAIGVPLGALEGLALADEPAALPAAPPALAARDSGLQRRLDLWRGLAEYAAAEAELALEIARQRPDLHLGPGTSWDQGVHKYLLGVAFELPLFHANEGPIAEAEARRRAVGEGVLALQEEIVGQIESARARYQGRLREREAAGAALEAARAQEERTRSALEAGASDRAALLDARLARLDAQRLLEASEDAARQALGALEDACQQPLIGSTERPPVADSPHQEPGT